METTIFNIEDFEEIELSDDENSTDMSKEWLFTDDLSDNMLIPDLELTNKNLGLESNVEDITYLVNKIFAFRQVLNGQPKKSVNDKGIELAAILLGYFGWIPARSKILD